MNTENLYIFVHVPKTAGDAFRNIVTRNLAPGRALDASFEYPQTYYNCHTRRVEISYTKEEFFTYLESLTDAEKNKIFFIGGHNAYFGFHTLFHKPARYITFLREPVARTISLYNFHRTLLETLSKKHSLKEPEKSRLAMIQDSFLLKGAVPTFEYWLEHQYNTAENFYSSQAKFLQNAGFIVGNMSKESMEQALSKFYFIGLTESFESDCAFLCEEMGISHSAKKSNASRKYIEEKDLSSDTLEKIRHANRDDILLYDTAKKHHHGNPLRDTSERYLPDSSDFLTGNEHFHRYFIARELARGKKVLDIACGEGYGSFLLAEQASEVISCDKNIEAIKHARHVYQRPNLSFMQGDARHLPIKGSNIFDLIVCFETLEHIAEQQTLMGEIKRLLKPDGLLIISTPNSSVYGKEGKNPFHDKELDLAEFKELLRQHFTQTKLYGQKSYIGSQVVALDGQQNIFTNYLTRRDSSLPTITAEDKPRYYLAIASNTVLKELGNSFFTDIDRLPHQELYQKTSDIWTLCSQLNTSLRRSFWRHVRSFLAIFHQ